MAHAFVLSDDSILCRQMPDGWWPLQVQLSPDSNGLSEQAYQVGHVALHESLAPSHWLSDDSNNTDNPTDNTFHSFTAQATRAMTYDYAVAHNVTLPIIAESSANTFVPYRKLMTHLPVALSDQISQAIQLLSWQADTQFCSRCASPTVNANQGERAMVCPVCRLRQYPRVQPCVITAITRPNPVTGEMQILLAHHHRHGQQNLPPMYGLIAGFVEVGESLEHAVVREVAEEVNISVSDIHYVSSQPWPFPSNLMLGFRASYASGDIILQEDELAHADFFDLSNLPRIPPKGSIARDLIDQVAKEQNINL
ncbi:NAD(+) diphosphatase [Psychrobacter sp. AOP7-B1-25]|uniref:NAD(+) diphosphatase n=1 Tax=Psychrobacter sp. AOP7-B1-25 TaxID=3457644 RepID=UPI00402B58BE